MIIAKSILISLFNLRLQDASGPLDPRSHISKKGETG